jgi:conjugal transfer mating pair stabilization protein TraN
MKIKINGAILWHLLLLGVVSAPPCFSQSTDEPTFQEAMEVGRDTGHDANQSVSVQTTDPALVPGYAGTDTPQAQYYDNPSGIEGAASEAAQNNEAAQTVREGHLNRPAFTIDPNTDPLIQNNQQIIDDPESIIGSVEDEYSECSEQTNTLPGSTQHEVCHVYTARENNHCERSLEVQCDLVEYDVNHQISASYSLVSYDHNGENESCPMNFTEPELGTQRVNAHFRQSCRTCDPINNPLQYGEATPTSCLRTWRYKLEEALAVAYQDQGEIVSITFHDGFNVQNGRATIEIVEHVRSCHWTDEWNNAACTAFERPSCLRLDDTCIDGPSTRIIEGFEVERECWRYNMTYRCLTSEIDEEPYCGELRQRGCVQIDSVCVSELAGDCVEYENQFQCSVGPEYTETVMDCSGQIFCADGNCFDSSYPPNDGLALAASHLAALEAMANDFDPESLRIFSGEALECSKAVLGFSNCCKDSGWGVDVGLQQCDEDEQTLGYAREQERCHNVGDYCANRDFFGVCTSRHYVYCCFGSKLARIIQEQGRLQLSQGWGDTDQPDCSGFTPEELQQLDFSQMDFSDFYADALNKITPVDQKQLQSELQAIMQDRFGQE